MLVIFPKTSGGSQFHSVITVCDERDHAMTKTFATFGLVIGLLNCYVGTSFAQVHQEWAARHSGPANQAVAQTIGVDATGNAYVTGYECVRFVGGSCDIEWATIKYDSDGNELWIARFGGPAGPENYPTAATVNSAGDVHVTGSICMIAACDELGCFCSDSDYATIKYDTRGNLLWFARYSSRPGASWDSARAITVDVVGNVYVTGESYEDGASDDYAT